MAACNNRYLAYSALGSGGSFVVFTVGGTDPTLVVAEVPALQGWGWASCVVKQHVLRLRESHRVLSGLRQTSERRDFHEGISYPI